MSTQEQINDEDCQPKAILPSIFSPTTGLDSAVTFAFTRMCYNTWFEGRCWRDVYKLLLDAFRLRLVTQRDLVGKSRRILEEEKSEIVDGLRNFIHLAEAVHELLPQDWNWVHAILCEGLACYHDTAEWYSLEYLPNEDEIAERYQDGLFSRAASDLCQARLRHRRW